MASSSTNIQYHPLINDKLSKILDKLTLHEMDCIHAHLNLVVREADYIWINFIGKEWLIKDENISMLLKYTENILAIGCGETDNIRFDCVTNEKKLNDVSDISSCDDEENIQDIPIEEDDRNTQDTFNDDANTKKNDQSCNKGWKTRNEAWKARNESWEASNRKWRNKRLRNNDSWRMNNDQSSSRRWTFDNFTNNAGGNVTSKWRGSKNVKADTFLSNLSKSKYNTIDGTTYIQRLIKCPNRFDKSTPKDTPGILNDTSDVLKNNMWIEHVNARDVIAELEFFQGIIYTPNDRHSLGDVINEIDNIYDGLAYIGNLYDVDDIYIMVNGYIRRIRMYSYEEIS